MTNGELDAAELAVKLAGALERAGIPYAIGGALAFGVWGIPRATVDVDVNVFVEPEELERVLGVLTAEGARFGQSDARGEVEREGALMGRFGALRLDVFFPSVPFSREAERTRRRARIAGVEISVLSAEAISVFKLLFFRGKDLVDLEHLVAVQRGRLDVAYIRQKLVEMMGEADERVVAWDRIVRDFG